MDLTVRALRTQDPQEGVAVLNRETMREMDVQSGDYVVVRSQDGGQAVTQAFPNDGVSAGDIRVDDWVRRTAGVGSDDTVTVEPIEVASADRVTVALPATYRGTEDHLQFRDALVSRGVIAGQTVPVPLAPDNAERPNFLPIEIAETAPTDAVVVRDWTKVRVASEPGAELDDVVPDVATDRTSQARYSDVGGLDNAIRRLHEMVALPMRHPALFRALGVEAPTGVLLYGPPGTGKTLLAHAVANETDASLHTVSGPSITSRYYGESEKRLREVFEAAEADAPAVVLLDDLDAFAGGRGNDGGPQVVAQLLSILDELGGERVTVIGTTSHPDALDPALRRPGRFDREIEVGVPDRDDRAAILNVHTQGVPLADDVDLDRVAERTHGFVGADVRNLVRESAMHTLRRVGRTHEFDGNDLDPVVFDDLTITRADVTGALREVEPSALREVFVEVPDVSWGDVGGLTDVKNRLREIVEWPLAHADAYERVALDPAAGVLLYGPPGTGKTLLAKAVANEADSNFISVKGPELLDKYVGESERGVREVFSKARENAPTVVFFDEIDAIASRRSTGGNGVSERVVSQLLTELDGLEDLEDVVVIATTNRRDLLDDALMRPGRFERHVHVDAPDEAARREIFNVHTAERPLADDVDLDALAARTEGFVGADIEAVCREAASAVVREFVAEGGDVADLLLSSAHFDAALEAVEASGPSAAESRER